MNTINTLTTGTLVINKTQDCISENTVDKMSSLSPKSNLMVANPPRSAAGILRYRGKFLPDFRSLDQKESSSVRLKKENNETVDGEFRNDALATFKIRGSY